MITNAEVTIRLSVFFYPLKVFSCVKRGGVVSGDPGTCFLSSPMNKLKTAERWDVEYRGHEGDY
jgi:hypothetical protein